MSSYVGALRGELRREISAMRVSIDSLERWLSLLEDAAEQHRRASRAGVRRAAARGEKIGRPRMHDPEKIRALRAKGLSYRDIATATGAPRGVICRALKAKRAQSKSKVSTQRTGGNRKARAK